MSSAWSAYLSLFLLGCGPLYLEAISSDTGEPILDDPIDPGRGTTDSEPETETDSDTRDDDPGDGDNAPQLNSIELTERQGNQTIQVTFEAFDLDNDLTGGQVSLTLGGTGYAFDIPGDLDSYEATGTSRCHVDASYFQAGDTVNGVMYVTDAAGHRSDTLTDSLTLATNSIEIPETGDEENSATNIGNLSLPAVLEGDIYRASNDGKAYTGDLDWVDFRVSSSTTATFSLVWDASGSDYDLHLLADGFPEAQSIQDGSAQPERFTRSLSSGTNYTVVVAGWNGSAGDWTLTID